MLHFFALCCNFFHCVAFSCTVLQFRALCCNFFYTMLHVHALRCNFLHCLAISCTVLHSRISASGIPISGQHPPRPLGLTIIVTITFTITVTMFVWSNPWINVQSASYWSRSGWTPGPSLSELGIADWRKQPATGTCKWLQGHLQIRWAHTSGNLYCLLALSLWP